MTEAAGIPSTSKIDELFVGRLRSTTRAAYKAKAKYIRAIDIMVNTVD
jgi:hypothetical protein